MEVFISVFLKINLNLLYLFILIFITIFFFEFLKKKKYLRSYKSIQRSHLDEVPRVGGLIIYFFIIISNILIIKSNLILNICFAAIPVIFISLKEDLFLNTKIVSRITSMVLSTLIFFVINNTTFPIINIPIIQDILNIYFFSFIFFSFSVLVIMNGMNFIDGLNGLSSFNFLCQFFSLFFLSYVYEDITIQIVSSFLILIILIFLMFNFPLGKIFLGDTGAYFLAFIISTLIINFFGQYNQILSWNAVLILFYPSFELLFSFIRKIFFEKKRPFVADHKHLHSLIYRYLVKKKKNKTANNLASILLVFFWASPLYVILFYKNLIMLILIIITLAISYILTYMFFLNRLIKISEK